MKACKIRYLLSTFFVVVLVFYLLLRSVRTLILKVCVCGIFFFLSKYFSLFIYLSIYLFLAVLGLCCGAWASHCGGFSCCGARALGAWAPAVVAHGLSSCGLRALERRLSSCGARLVAPWHVEFSRTRARTRVSCLGRRILNHCATREVHMYVVLI